MRARQAKNLSKEISSQNGKAEFLMQTLMESSSDYILICDRYGKPLFFNDAYKQIMKETLGIDMVPGLVPHRLLPSAEAVQWWDDLHARVLGGETFKVEYSHEFESGEIRHFEFSFTPIQNNGDIQGFTEISRDVTKRKEAEDAVVRSVSQLKTLTDSALDSIFCKDIERRYTFVNPAMTKLLGCTKNDLIGKNPEEVFGKEAAKIIQDVDDLAFSGKKVSEIRPLVINGIRHYFHTVQVPMEIKDGTVMSINGIVRDVTKNILIQQENAYLATQLRHSEEKYRGIFENSPLGILHIDKNGIITTCNAKVAETLGSRIDRLIGFNTLDSLNNEGMVNAIDAVLSGKSGNTNYEGEYRSVTGTGSPYIRGVFSAIKAGDGSITGAIGVFEDITDRKKIEQELQQANDKLEQRVAKRTADLSQKTERLGEANIALKILLEKRNEDRSELEKNLLSNVEKRISPYLAELKMSCTDEHQQAFLDIIQTNLAEITSSFESKPGRCLASLTKKQVQVADLIKQGKTTKEIASLLKLSPRTVACHRQEIRKRLCLTNKKIHLQTALMTNTK